MKKIQEIRDWLLENAVDEEGDLYLIGLDFSDFDGNVYIDNIKVKNDLYQNCQEVGGNLYQTNQEVGKNLYQAFQNVGEDLYQTNQEVGKDFYNHKLKNNECWEEKGDFVIRRKNMLKEITLEELEKMGFKLKEEGK